MSLAEITCFGEAENGLAAGPISSSLCSAPFARGSLVQWGNLADAAAASSRCSSYWQKRLGTTTGSGGFDIASAAANLISATRSPWFVLLNSHWVCNGRRACDVRMDELSTRFTVDDLNLKFFFWKTHLSNLIMNLTKKREWNLNSW